METLLALTLLAAFFCFVALWGVREALARLNEKVESLEAELESLRAVSPSIPDSEAPRPSPVDVKPAATPQPIERPSAPEPPPLVSPALGAEGDPPPERPSPSEQPPALPIARPARTRLTQPTGQTTSRAARTRPARTPAPSIDWERWVGLRGAAVAGGIALVFAGVFMVQLAIERGWLGAMARDLLAFSVGAAGLLAHAFIRRRGKHYNALADSLGGAGTVLIYGACWAAARLHGLIEVPVALSIMTVTTGVCLSLAVKTRAPLLAAFALVGGFATPLLLDVVHGGSIGLLLYVAILNAAVLGFAKRRDWAWALPMGVIGTLAIATVWVGGIDPALHYGWAAAAFGTIALVFAFTPQAQPTERNRAPIQVGQFLSQNGLLLLGAGPAAVVTGADNLWPLLGFLMLLAVSARRIDARVGGRFHLQFAAFTSVAALAATTYGLRVFTSDWGQQHISNWVAATAVLGALFSVLSSSREGRTAPFNFALLSLFAAPLCYLFPERCELLPWSFYAVVAWLSAIGIFGSTGKTVPVQRAAWIGLAAGVALACEFHPMRGVGIASDSPFIFTAPLLAAALGAIAYFTRTRSGELSQCTRAAALLLPLLALAQCVIPAPAPPTLMVCAATLLVVSALVRSRDVSSAGQTLACLAYSVLGALMLLHWASAPGAVTRAAEPTQMLLLFLLTAAALPIGVALSARRSKEADGSVAPLAWISSLPALALGLGCPALLEAQFARAEWNSTLGWHGMVLAAAIVLLCAAALAWRAASARHTGRVFLGLGGALVSLSIARGATSQWPAVAIALGAGWLALMTFRPRSTCAGTAATMISGVAALSIVLLTFTADLFLAEPLFLPLDLTINYVAAAIGVILALIGATKLPEDDPGRKSMVVFCVTVLLTIAFGWLNASVLNSFIDSGPIEIEPGRMQTRDLALSLAWAAFGGFLLALGLWKRSKALRWASLCVLIATILKVFLYDLGNLEGLARVGSFFGLSVALLCVSVTYARLPDPDRAAGDRAEDPPAGPSGRPGPDPLLPT